MELTVFEKCKAIRNLYLRGIGEITTYSNWSNDIKLKNILDIPTIIDNWKDKYGDFRSLNLEELYEDELVELGFSNWSVDNPIKLIPLWLYPYIDKNNTYININNKNISGKDLDDDHRMGSLSYGIYGKSR